MRRGSFQPFGQGTGEPLIVVEESGGTDDEDARSDKSSQHSSGEDDSPAMNPYLLSPWGGAPRKHSLPTPQCAGITASQVRRLSERGGEGSDGAKVREAAFLATLSANPTPASGGRRHSVVTISKVPPTLFGRNRRESIAAYPLGMPNRVLGSRRESNSSIIGPPSTDHHGSVHNLQLDIMDDIVTARKVRMKLWNTSNERVCEVQPMEEGGCTQRYAGRRFSDFVGTTLPVIPSGKRRASEVPPPLPGPSGSGAGDKPGGASGIVCTNTDLISILSSLTSSATEINEYTPFCDKVDSKKQSATTAQERRNRLRNKRSSSFDVSILYDTGSKLQLNASATGQNKNPLAAPSSWFVKRHQPIQIKNGTQTKATFTPSFTAAKDAKHSSTSILKKSKDAKEANKVVWDGKSGSVVDAQVLGSAIEVFLRRGADSPTTNTNSAPSKGAIPKMSPSPNKNVNNKSKSGWFSSKPDDEESTEGCDTSLCSTLKDLFVK